MNEGQSKPQGDLPEQTNNKGSEKPQAALEFTQAEKVEGLEIGWLYDVKGALFVLDGQTGRIYPVESTAAIPSLVKSIKARRDEKIKESNTDLKTPADDSPSKDSPLTANSEEVPIVLAQNPEKKGQESTDKTPPSSESVRNFFVRWKEQRREKQNPTDGDIKPRTPK